MDINISSALDWWDVWKLRLLVHASTLIQVFLFLYGTARRAPVQRWFRACIWLAYLAGDSLAIYALASLFNRHGRQGTVGSTLEVLWAPVLLIHLAGQEQITAYSIQDNELWRRHIVILVIQVAIALYVFIESWSRARSRRLLASAILLFIIGIYKMSTKPWALKRATFRNLVSSPASLARRKQLIGFGSGSSGWLLDTWKALTKPIRVRRKAFFFTAGDPTGSGPSEWRQAADEQEEKEVADAELDIGEYVHKVVEAAREAKAGRRATLPLFLAEAETFAADILVPYSRRLKILEAMFKIDWKGRSSSSAFAVRMGLDEIYYRLYTRAKVASTPISLNLRLLTSSLAVVAIALFATSPKSHDDVVDVKVTYILFCCVALLEVLSLATVLLLDYPIVLPPASYNAKHMVYQQSLISSAARRRKPTLLLSLAKPFGYDDMLNRHWYYTETPASDMIHEAVLDHVKNGLVEYIRNDAVKYRSFNDLRGQWAVRKRLPLLPVRAATGQDVVVVDPASRNHLRALLLRTVWRPFDESVLLWHVATEICFHRTDAAGGPPRKVARVISCYMVYLLSARPEMLMLGTRSHLFSIALDDVDYMLRYSDLDADDGDDHSIGPAILRTAQRMPSWVYRDGVGPLIPEACQLADALLQLLRLQEKETWEMVQDVWVEMLCYSASRGRGYMHAVSHGERWELLSRIWLLLCFMGMETLADRLQRAKEEEESKETTSNVDVHTK